MNLLDRYIGTAVLQSTLVVMTVMLALFAFATFAGELETVGSGNYGAGEALYYTFLLLPRLAYQLFPIVVLLGSIIGLGMLASQSELIVVRAAGVSIKRIIWTVMKIGLLLVLLMILIGEFIAPEAELKAQNLKAEALSGQVSFRTAQGLWAKDGHNVIHIRDLLSANKIGNVSIYEFDGSSQLVTVTKARQAIFENEKWHLQGVSRSDISDSGIKTSSGSNMEWKSLLNPDLIGVVTVKPDYLSVLGLYEYIGYLKDNALDANQYVLALWKKLLLPVTTAVMIFLSVPFVFGPLRSVGVGQRIFVGSLCGIGFFLIDQTIGHMGLVYGVYPALSALAAPFAFFMLAAILMRRVR